MKKAFAAVLITILLFSFAGCDLSSQSSVNESTGNSSQTVNGLRPEFKKAMDSYEAFYDEYCEFMQDYSKNPSDFSYLAKYAELLVKAQEMDAAFEKWDTTDMSSEELVYYYEVTGRVLEKLSNISN